MSVKNNKRQVVLRLVLAVALMAGIAVAGLTNDGQQRSFQEICMEDVKAQIEGITPAQPAGGDTVTIKFRLTYVGDDQLRDCDGNAGSQVVVQWSTDTGYIGMPHYLPSVLHLQPGETSALLSDSVTLPQTLNYLEVEIGLPEDTMQGYAVVGGGVVRYNVGGERFADCQATPQSGNLSTEFCFRAQYISTRNTAPTAVKVAIDGQLYQMQKENANDTDYTDGCWYQYTSTLPLGQHSFKCVAFGNNKVLAESALKYYPTVKDTTPPVVVGGGEDRPTLRVLRKNKVTLSGTATDNVGVAQVQWSTNGHDWQRAQGTNQWQFAIDVAVADQATQSMWVYVRAKDAAGNYTPADQWWKQKIVFDNRHPYVVDHFVTEISLVGLDLYDEQGMHQSAPFNRGTPTMGNPYLVCFKVKNPAPRQYDVIFEWEEEGSRLEYDEPDFTQFANWDVDMDACTSGGPQQRTIPPYDTSWLYTRWSHSWKWIPDQGWTDFLLDLVISFIPVGSEYTDYVSFCTWSDTIGAAVLQAKVTVKPGDLSSDLLPPTPDPVTVTIKVSIPKRMSLYSSVVAGVAGVVATNLGFANVWWNPPLGAALFAAEAAFIATSHALYEAAEDPDPNYQQRVQLKRIECPEIDKLRGEEGYDIAREAVQMTQNARAFRQAYTRYLGAIHAGDKKWAQIHAEDASKFAQAAAKHTDMIYRALKEPLEKFKQFSKEDRDKILTASKQGLPDIERQLLTKRFGLNPKDVERWSRKQGALSEALLRTPENGAWAFKHLTTALNKLSEEMRNKSRG